MNDPLIESPIFYGMMLVNKTRPALAIYYGKQAVNLLQQVRGNIQGLDRRCNRAFFVEGGILSRPGRFADYPGRLPEAQQVLDLLKQQEYSDYVRGAADGTLSPLTLTPAEQQAEQEYQKSTAQIVSLGEQWAELKKIARARRSRKRSSRNSQPSWTRQQGLSDYYDRLYVLFGKTRRQQAERRGQGRSERAAGSDCGFASHRGALHHGDERSLPGDCDYGRATVAREYAISETDLNGRLRHLNRRCATLRSDPRPLAQELYKILIGPVKADLEQAHAETLVWSLDGVLRYVPMAALYDGKQYVVEKYSTVTITPASFAHLGEKPDLSRLSVAAMGISRKYEETARAARSGRRVGRCGEGREVQGANGVLPGTILLDGQFTEKAMENGLSTRHSVVHIASHFVFKPGDDSQSYLLLSGKDEGGAGFHLTVAEFRKNRSLLLQNTDLLTLSACETGMSGNAGNGLEVDGLGMTAQLRGAKAVISSLWSVNDASTGKLMGDFYRRWAEGGGKVTKVEALRQAQLDLLLGQAGPKGSGVGRGSAGECHPGCLIRLCASLLLGHPLYLMGNWR